MNKGAKPEESDREPVIVLGPIGEPQPPGTVPLFEVDFEEARESEDYHGIYRDMEFVVSVTRELRGMLLQQGPQPSGVSMSASASENVLRSLWVAALVTYGRCFHKGKRRWFDESIFEGQPEDILIWHRYFRDIRDKHVAHSVNPFEIHATGVQVVDHDGSSPRVERAMVAYMIRAQEQPEVVGYLEWLAAYARDVAWKRHSEANKKLINKAKSLSKEQLQKLRPLAIIPEVGFEAAKARRR